MKKLQQLRGSHTLLVVSSLALCGCAGFVVEDLSEYADDSSNSQTSGGSDGSGGSAPSGGSPGGSLIPNRPSSPSGGTASGGTSSGGGMGGEAGMGAEGGSGGMDGEAGMGGMGGEGGTDGSGGQPGSGTEYVSDYAVSYQVVNTEGTSQYVGAQFLIWNFGFDSAPLNELTLRYYYTNEVGPAANIVINWGNIDNGGAAQQIGGEIQFQEVELTPPRLDSGADYYLEFSFSGSRTVEENGKVEFAFQMDAPQNNPYTQTGDYSFDASKTGGYSEWNRVVLYRNGEGLWGIEP